MFKNIVQYCKESYDELVTKVTWPSLKELTNTSLIVLYASIIIGLVVFCMDRVFNWIMDIIYSIFN
jgi:preprotein translocase subunit SecE